MEDPSEKQAQPEMRVALAPRMPAREAAMYRKIAAKIYMKMPPPIGVVRVPFERLDDNATNLWLLIAQAAVEALNEIDV